MTVPREQTRLNGRGCRASAAVSQWLWAMLINSSPCWMLKLTGVPIDRLACQYSDEHNSRLAQIKHQVYC